MNDTVQHPMTSPLMEDKLYHHGSPDPLFVRIGTPAPDPLPGGDFYCPVEVRLKPEGPPVDHVVVFGINALQAVEIAFVWLRQKWPAAPKDDQQ